MSMQFFKSSSSISGIRDLFARRSPMRLHGAPAKQRQSAFISRNRKYLQNVSFQLGALARAREHQQGGHPWPVVPHASDPLPLTARATCRRSFPWLSGRASAAGTARPVSTHEAEHYYKCLREVPRALTVISMILVQPCVGSRARSLTCLLGCPNACLGGRRIRVRPLVDTLYARIFE